MRRVAGYGLPNALRMTIGTEDDNRTVVDGARRLHERRCSDDHSIFETVALIGIGLIGSSISHATRRGGLAGRIVGSAKTEATRATALRLGLVDEAFESAAEAVKDADLVILCTPVGACGAGRRGDRAAV